jgi:hypothetical protein
MFARLPVMVLVEVVVVSVLMFVSREQRLGPAETEPQVPMRAKMFVAVHAAAVSV